MVLTITSRMIVVARWYLVHSLHIQVRSRCSNSDRMQLASCTQATTLNHQIQAAPPSSTTQKSRQNSLDWETSKRLHWSSSVQIRISTGQPLHTINYCKTDQQRRQRSVTKAGWCSCTTRKCFSMKTLSRWARWGGPKVLIKYAECRMLVGAMSSLLHHTRERRRRVEICEQLENQDTIGTHL